jgi:hypothetical protein
MLNHLPPPHSQVEASHKRIAKPTLYQLEKKFSSIMAESQPVDGLDPAAESESEHEDGERAESHTKDAETTESTNAESAPAKKKKKSKKSKVAAALTGKKDSTPDPPKPAGSKMTPDMMNTLLEMNPSLKGELSSMNKQQASELLKKMDVSELLTGLSLGPKNQKDIASYKFWQTQPVPKFEEDKSEEGPIKPVIPEMVPKNPAPLPEAYEWCELDLTNDDEIATPNHSSTGLSSRQVGSAHGISASAPRRVENSSPLSSVYPPVFESVPTSCPSLKSTSSAYINNSAQSASLLPSSKKSRGAATWKVYIRQSILQVSSCPRLLALADTSTAHWTG